MTAGLTIMDALEIPGEGSSGNSAGQKQPESQLVQGLHSVLHHHDERLKQLSHKATCENTERARFMEQFLNNCRTIWMRVFEQVRDSLGEHGHHAVIVLNQDRYQECLNLDIDPNTGSFPKPKQQSKIHISANEVTLRVLIRFVMPDYFHRPTADASYRVQDLTAEVLMRETVRGIGLILERAMAEADHPEHDQKVM